MECRHTHPHLWLLYTILYTTYVWERVHPGRLVYYRQNTSARRRIVPTLAFIRRPAWSISEPETFFSAQLVLFPPPPSAEITDATPSQDYQARVNIFPAQKPLHHVDVDRLKRSFRTGRHLHNIVIFCPWNQNLKPFRRPYSARPFIQSPGTYQFIAGGFMSSTPYRSDDSLFACRVSFKWCQIPDCATECQSCGLVFPLHNSPSRHAVCHRKLRLDPRCTPVGTVTGLVDMLAANPRGCRPGSAGARWIAPRCADLLSCTYRRLSFTP